MLPVRATIVPRVCLSRNWIWKEKFFIFDFVQYTSALGKAKFFCFTLDFFVSLWIMIGLADCNNFFVSCERSVDPSLDGVPMVVLSNNDGCVVARSNESKRMGVKMGQPAFEIRDLIYSGKIVAYSGNHLLYRDKSLKVHDIFRRFVPSTIDYSVDESFLDMNGIPEDVIPEIGDAICDTCWKEERIPVTLGFAPTKTLAKIATEVGKKRGERIVMLAHDEELKALLHKMPIGDLWGVGRRLSKRLYYKGVYTIGDFYGKDLSWIRSELGVMGERSWQELHGMPCIELEHVSRKMQDSISETRTFPEDIDDFDYLRARMAIYCAHVSKRLRAMSGECGELTVFLRTNRFHTERGYYSPQATVVFSPAIDDTAAITKAAVGCLERIFNPSLKYKRAGVVLSRINPRRSITPSLFEEEGISIKRSKSRDLMKAVDGLNSGEREHVVKLASQLTKGHVGHNDGYSSSFASPIPDSGVRGGK